MSVLRSTTLVAIASLTACGARAVTGGTTDDDAGTEASSATTGEETQGDEDGEPVLDVGARPDPQIDILFVVDNSFSMRDEQRNVAANISAFWDELAQLEGSQGDVGLLLESSVHVMVTTTDLGGPMCPAVDGYAPAAGGPLTEGCNARIDEFVRDEIDLTDACTQACPTDVLPDGAFISIEVGGASNVPGDAIGSALACLGAQGIVGCEYGQPLEAMLRALDPDAAWNDGPDPFLRAESDVVIVLITDEPDCSVADPAVFQDLALMNVHPDSGQPAPSHAVCWNALATCQGKQLDGSYQDCSPSDTGVHPVQRYVDRLRDELSFDEGRTVFMLAALGVPQVLWHNEQPPFEPTGGGIADLVYRDWVEGEFPVGDVLPGHGPTAAHEQWRHGIGPGCTGEDGQGGFLAQATPPVRANEVCQALDEGDAIRCCIESICDHDFSLLARCLSARYPCPWGRQRHGERCIPPP